MPQKFAVSIDFDGRRYDGPMIESAPCVLDAEPQDGAFYALHQYIEAQQFQIYLVSWRFSANANALICVRNWLNQKEMAWRERLQAPTQLPKSLVSHFLHFRLQTPRADLQLVDGHTWPTVYAITNYITEKRMK
jgi:hypothetical protein